MNRHTAITTAVLFAIASSSVALAQSNASKSGLDAIDDSRLQSDLASRGLSSLLDYSFEQNKTPETQRTGIRTLAALRQLSDPNAKLTPKQRDEVIAQVTKGIEQALPTLKDPKLLMQQAGTLVKEGVAGPLDTIEYWGENPRLQAQLRPLTETIQKIYAQSIVQAQAAINVVADKMNNGLTPTLEKQYEQAEELKTNAEYTKAMAAYSLVRSIDKADPKRATAADEAITALQAYDTGDGDIHAGTRLGLAKLQMAKGDFANAQKLFESFETEAAKFKPAADVSQRYQAKYFWAQSKLLAGDLPGARKALTDVNTWTGANVPKEFASSTDAAAKMLEYRITSAEAEKATGVAKDKLNDGAIAVLVGLVKEYPQYRAIIFEQLFDRLPANADVKKLDPLLLGALMQKGDVERAKTEGEKVDKPALENAVNAARELIARKGKPGIEPATVEDAAIRLPYYLLKLESKADAAESFLAYVQAYPQGQYAQNAIDTAGAIVFEMQAKDQTNPKLAGLMDTFLPTAIDKFGHKELAYMYAMRLRELDKFTEAVKYYQQVPPTDPNSVKADYFEMLSLKQQLDADEGKLGATGRKAMVVDIQKLSDAVNAAAPAAAASATRDSDKNFYRFAPARTGLLAASLTKTESKDAQRTLELLQNFETAVKGAPGEDSLLSEALFLRVGSYMDLGQTDKATENLVTLLNTKGGQQGLQIVFDLLQRLDQDYNAALARNDAEAQRTIARNRADLSGYLVTWASNNKDPKIKQFTYKYRVFDASSKQLAANLATDPATKTKGLQDAQKLFKDLQSDANVELYKKTLPPTADAGTIAYPDPQVMMGLALVQYDLANYKEAAPMFSRLLNDGKLGAETRGSMQNGELVRVDNDQFWEATLKQLTSFVRLAKAPDADDKAKATLASAQNRLKQLYIKSGKAVGGKKFATDFEKLRQEIIPDFKIQDLDATTQPTAPTPPVAQN